MGTATYLQVWNTYWSWWLFKLLVLLLSAGFLVAMASATDFGAVWGLAAVVVGVLGAFAHGALLKLQFARPDARIVPGYAAPHVGVAAVITILVAVVLPAAVTLRHGRAPLGIVALAAAAYILFLWAGSVMSVALNLTLPWLWIFFFLPGERLRARAEQLIEGELPWHSAAILLAACGAFMALVQRLARLTGDDPVYARNLLALTGKIGRRNVLWGQGAAGWEQMDRPWSRLTQRSAEVPEDLRSAAGGRPLSVRLWRIGNSVLSMKVMAAFYVLIMALVVFLINQREGGSLPLPVMFVVPTLFGIFFPIMVLAQKGMTAGYESLRPVSRSHYASRLILAAAADVTEYIVTMVLCSALVIALWPGALADLESISRFALMGLAAIASVFGFGVWASSLRCPPFTNILLLVGAMGCFFLLASPMMRGLPGVAPAAFVSLIAIGMGAAFLYFGYRRWTRMELG